MRKDRRKQDTARGSSRDRRLIRDAAGLIPTVFLQRMGLAMNKNRLGHTAILSLLAASAAHAPAVYATPITVDFAVVSTTSSSDVDDFYTVGTVGSGYFTFDDSLMPSTGTGTVGNSLMGAPTLDLFFDWFGTTFDSTNAAIATLTFVNGLLADWWIGGTYIAPVCGIMRFACMSSAGTAPDFSLIASSGGSMNDGVHAGFGAGYGTVSWSVRSVSVPEPGTFGLLGLGLLSLAFTRKRLPAA
jgi:hypothetical protein